MTRRQGMNVTGMTIHGCCTNKIQGTSNQWEFQGTSNKWFIIGWLGVYVLESIFSVQASFGRCKYFQWEFQDPRLEVPTIYKAYFSGLNFREYPHNSYGPKYGTFTYLQSVGSWRSPIDLSEANGINQPSVQDFEPSTALKSGCVRFSLGCGLC